MRSDYYLPGGCARRTVGRSAFGIEWPSAQERVISERDRPDYSSRAAARRRTG
jgi:hypothetical protein